MWQSISTAPFCRELELAVIDDEGPHLIIFPAVKYLAAGKMPKQKGRSTYTRHIRAFGLKSANSVLFSTNTINYVATEKMASPQHRQEPFSSNRSPHPQQLQ